MSLKTWGGRFSGDTDDRVEAFTESISLDRRLYRHDVRAQLRPVLRRLLLC
jgi:argininosuccinate lyase